MADRIPGSAPASEHGRYAALDLLRGVAAVMVMFVHLNDHYAGVIGPQSGYLAVDLFFLLSGFVIANAYDKRFDAGWTAMEFIKVRLVRLYPLYLLAMTIGTARLLLQLRVGAAPPSLRDAGTDIGLGFLMIPSPTTLGHPFDPPFPMNLPAWSLFFELIMNVVYALAHKWLKRTVLLTVVAVSGAALFIVALVHGSLEVGNYWHTLGLGIPRAAFPFFLGVLMNRERLPVPRVGGLAALALALSLVLALIVAPGVARPLWDIGMDFAFFPVLVALGSAVQVRGAVEKLSYWGGATSYALYVLHVPAIELAGGILKRLAPVWHLSRLSGPLFVVFLLLGSWLVDRYYDTPVRRWLSQRLRKARRSGRLGGQASSTPVAS